MTQKLFKKDSSGKIRYLLFSVVGDTILQSSGVLGTPNEVTHQKRATPKNVGKANETTGAQQALNEVQSSIKDKLTKGYFLTQEEAENEVVILPMLAKVFAEEQKKIDWQNCYGQPKLDGMRCLAFINNGEVRLMSRDGKDIQHMDHIKRIFKGILGSWILDGELYNKDLGGFQSQTKAFKKYSKLSEEINFNVYDMILDEPFRKRWIKLKSIVDFFRHPNLKLVQTYTLETEEVLKQLHVRNIAEGYEGTIVRWGDEPYKVNGRSSNLLKYKDFQDIALPIIDIVPADQRPEWGKPIFELNGKQFSAGMKYSHEDRIDFLKNKKDYIGKTAEVRFFEYTDDGIPRFPVMYGIRLDC